MLETLRRLVQEVNQARNLDQALSIIVQRVKRIMDVGVCSVYLRDVDGAFVLMATDGLRQESVGKVRLQEGEGLISLVASRAEPINLRSALANHAEALEEFLPFIQTLLRDLKDYQTLPKYTLRRLAAVEIGAKAPQKRLNRFKEELTRLRASLGNDYLERIAQRVKDFRSEIIIAIENQSVT